MIEQQRKTTNAGILLLRFLGAHILCTALGIGLSLLMLPLWTALVYRVSGREVVETPAWAWYLLVITPFYLAIASLTILVVYTIWTGGGETMKRWRNVLRVTAWLHGIILLLINLFVGGRALP